MIGTMLIALPIPVLSTNSNLVYISPSHTANLAIGTAFNVTVKVAGFDSFNGWDIHVKVNSSIINPIGLTTSSNIFEANGTVSSQTELANCVNGLGNTPSCSSDPFGGSGIIYSAVVDNQGGTAMGDGLLFTITYNVTGIGFSDITIFQDVLSSGSSFNPILHKTLSGTYGSQLLKPDFSFESIPNLSVTLAQSHNVTGSATITLDSIDNFSGQASISAVASLAVSVSPNHILLRPDGSNSSTVTVTLTNMTQSTQYLVNVTAIIGPLHHWAVFSVKVNPIPDFIMSVLPSILKVHATNSGSSIITLDTQSGFSGSIHLKMDVPSVSGLVATIAATDFTISPGQPASTVFAVRTPPSAFPFKYLINITASSPASSTHLPFTITVRSPTPDFLFQISGPGFVVQAGQSRTYMLNITSVDYFRGQIFLLAISLSGMKESFTRPAVALEYGNSSFSQITVSTDAYLAPGNHYLNLTALGTTFLGATNNHTITETITVVSPPPAALTILGLQPVAYFGIVGALWIGVIGAAIREIRKPKQQRFLT